MSPMGPLQPGVPNPAMIPEDWPLSVIDLKHWGFLQFFYTLVIVLILHFLCLQLTTVNLCSDTIGSFHHKV